MVLIAEDSEDTRDMYGEFLEFSGFQVLTAVDGLEVLRLTTEHSPDVIILDMSMPRMNGDGFDAHDKARGEGRGARDSPAYELPVLAESNNATCPAPIRDPPRGCPRHGDRGRVRRAY